MLHSRLILPNLKVVRHVGGNRRRFTSPLNQRIRTWRFILPGGPECFHGPVSSVTSFCFPRHSSLCTVLARNRPTYSATLSMLALQALKPLHSTLPSADFTSRPGKTSKPGFPP